MIGPFLSSELIQWDENRLQVSIIHHTEDERDVQGVSRLVSKFQITLKNKTNGTIFAVICK